MKISQALLQLVILTHTLTTTTTLAIPVDASGPPVFDDHVDTQLIKNRELDFLQANGTDLALEERGVDGGDVASRQLQESMILLTVIVLIIISPLIVDLIDSFADDNPVSTSNLMFLALLVAVLIPEHSVVRHTLKRQSPPCIIIIPITTMLYATHNSISRSMGPWARIGIICTRRFLYPWEGHQGEHCLSYIMATSEGHNPTGMTPIGSVLGHSRGTVMAGS
jgi:hypothetical protein